MSSNGRRLHPTMLLQAERRCLSSILDLMIGWKEPTPWLPVVNQTARTSWVNIAALKELSLGTVLRETSSKWIRCCPSLDQHPEGSTKRLDILLNGIISMDISRIGAVAVRPKSAPSNDLWCFWDCLRPDCKELYCIRA